MVAAKYAISLTGEERALLSRIRFDRDHMDHAAYVANEAPVLGLLRSLFERGAIPEARWKVWAEPEYRHGHMKGSHRDLFARNGTASDEAYTHPSFLPFLHYFLFGAELPEPVIAAFETQAGDMRGFSSSDVVPLGKEARRLTREYGLQKHDASEQFFRLALDLGIWVSYAHSVRESVMQVR